MNSTQANDNQQAAIWNGRAGHAWVEMQALLDDVFRPFEHLLVAAARERGATCVLDIGCGTGGTTLALTRALSAGALCTGVDISEPMIAAARARAGTEGLSTIFQRADAQEYPFEPATFDMIVSRFGVMFFADPVRAFTNLRRATCHAGELRMVAFRSASENPFMTTAERAAAPLLPNLPARRPDGPGQFAFADKRLVESILRESGWSSIDIQPIDVACAFPATDLDRYVARLGPVGLALQEANADTRAEVIEKVRAAFAPYLHGAEVRFNAGCWMISARAE
ncbi:MAG TPA: methyltransferase domain-containing protein [Bryobacteraceae bacterium]|nr:methyltransferase domain-containing protein [Bryobacteraceae bacterium]